MSSSVKEKGMPFQICQGLLERIHPGLQGARHKGGEHGDGEKPGGDQGVIEPGA